MIFNGKTFQNNLKIKHILLVQMAASINLKSTLNNIPLYSEYNHKEKFKQQIN